VFDIGFSELLLIAVVALVVLGPERLPKAARFAGLWVRRARNQWDSVKQELERELHAEELRRNLQQVQAAMRQSEAQLRASSEQLQDQTDALRRQVEGDEVVPVVEASPVEPAAGVPGNAIESTDATDAGEPPTETRP
jgi:twin arginine-targeting protein translocase TatB